MNNVRENGQAQPKTPVDQNAQAQAPFAALLEAWQPSARLNSLVGENLSKRDKRRIVAVVQQYQFGPNTPDDTIARFLQLAAKEVQAISPCLSSETIQQLWKVPPQELFSEGVPTPN